MFDPEAVLAQVEQGQIPDTWRVFHAKKAATLWIAVLSGLAILVFLWIAIGALAAYFLAFPLNIDPLLANNLLRTAAALAVAVAVAAGVLIAARAVRRAKHTVLVVMPEGVVEHVGASKKSIKTISYADITGMKMKTHTASNSTRVTIYIELQHSDGRTEMWVPVPGPADEVAQLVIAGHAQYVALHGSQALSQGPEESIHFMVGGSSSV